jgi:hypothetical protein
MGLLSIFRTKARREPTEAAPSSRIQSDLSQNPASSQTSTRRELLRVVLRDTLHRHGIPTAWVAAEMLATASRTGERGMHWRIHIKHWDTRLLNSAVALQNALMRRLVTFDPLAPKWLTGISWQFSIEDESQCPPLPHPTSWTTPERHPPAAGRAPAQAPADDMMIGSVHLATAPAEDAERADLERLLALRDEDFRKHAEDSGPRWANTEPAKI